MSSPGSRLSIALLLLGLFGGLPAAAAPAYDFPESSQRIVSYDMRVRLDPESHLVTGTQRISWRNDSDETVPTLWFHLYLNAFLNDASTLAVEAGKDLIRERRRDERDHWGYCRFTRLELADGRDLLGTLEHRAPDDGNPEDRTVARVLLPEAVRPGETVELVAEFETKLPLARRRSGHAGDYYFAAQWFPKLSVYEGVERAPETEGWSCHQYHAHSEFHADHGSYDLSLTLPPAYGGNPPKVGATGKLMEVRAATPSEAGEGNEGWLTYVFKAQDVHDFAWAADPDFLVFERTYVHAERRTDAVIEEERFLREEVGVPASQLALPDLQVRLLLQPDHAASAERHLEAVMQAITWYGLWFGPYPYPQITVVDPQHDARATGGMEYPMIITAGSRWLSPPESLSPEDVVVHEFGHQYFYLLVGNDEVGEAWLDEGFTSYSDDKVLERVWGGPRRHHAFAHLQLPRQSLLRFPSSDETWTVKGLLGLRSFGRRPDSWIDRLFQHPDLSWMETAVVTDPLGSRRRGARPDAWKDPMDTASFRTLDRGSYGAIAYGKPALLLTTLERTLGRSVFLSALREYCARHRYSHPTGSDFFRVLEEVAGVPMEEARAYLAPAKLDYSVHSVEVEERRSPQGLVHRAGELELVTVEKRDADESERTRTRIRVQRIGALEAPVEILIKVKDEAEARLHHWDGRAPWHEIVVDLEGDPRVTAVDVDPDLKLPLDSDRLNNHWRKEKSELPALSLGARALYLIQSAMLGARTLS